MLFILEEMKIDTEEYIRYTTINVSNTTLADLTTTNYVKLQSHVSD
jgi:hypothetical protein